MDVILTTGGVVDGVDLPREVPLDFVQQHAHRAAVIVDDHEVGLAVPVHIPNCHRTGSVPVAKVCWFWKVPLPLPSSTLTVLLLSLATTRSSLPSPFTSTNATDYGSAPVANVCWFWKVPLPLPNSKLTGVAVDVGDAEVELAVPVHVAQRHRNRARAGGESLLVLEGAIARCPTARSPCRL